MSKYTTGEMAKLCGVSVRTVQYYDGRGILCPSQLSEGGRRLYSEEDLRKLKVICFLRGIDLPINVISQLLEDPDPGSVISLLLCQQREALLAEIQDRQQKLSTLNALQQEIKGMEHFCVESIGDIAHIMENRKKLRRLRIVLFAVGIPLEILEIGTLILWIARGLWQPFAIGLCIEILGAIWLSRYYHQNVAYICPQCHQVFKPRFKEMFFAAHTPRTRRLLCPHCGRKGFCVETWGGDEPAASE